MYAAPLIIFGVTVLAVAALYGAHGLLAMRRRPLRVMPHLSGGEPREHAVSRFHPRWYMVALMLLAFDMEMVFMYPWALVVGIMGTPAVVEMFVFLGLLIAGVLYAWREGAFRWS